MNFTFKQSRVRWIRTNQFLQTKSMNERFRLSFLLGSVINSASFEPINSTALLPINYINKILRQAMYYSVQPMMMPAYPNPSGIMDQVLAPAGDVGGLYLSGVEATQNQALLQNADIRAVLTVGSELVFVRFPVDTEAHLIVQAHDSAANDLKQHFQKAYEFIETQRNLNRNVLVHCYVGVSRSATIVIAYLMQKFGWSMQQAYQQTVQCRPFINPNPGFLAQLRRHEQDLLRRTMEAEPVASANEQPKNPLRQSMVGQPPTFRRHQGPPAPSRGQTPIRESIVREPGMRVSQLIGSPKPMRPFQSPKMVAPKLQSRGPGMMMSPQPFNRMMNRFTGHHQHGPVRPYALPIA